jgi:hypothetical protein
MRMSLSGVASTNRFVRLLLAPVVVLVILGACSVTKQLDTSKGEGQIKTYLQDNFAMSAEVSCPEREVKKGDVFECKADLSDGQSLRLKLTQDDDKGNVSFEQAQAIIDVEQAVTLIQSEVQKSASVAVTADCGSAKYLIKDPGTTFDCQVTPTAGGTGTTAVVTVKDLEGAVDIVLQ